MDGRAGRVRRSVVRAAATEWRALGVVGRVAAVGLVASVGIAVALGIGIPSAVERELIESHLEFLDPIVHEMVDSGTIALDATVVAPESLGQAVDSVAGADVVGVNVWRVDGTVSFSEGDSTELFGAHSGARLASALAGSPQGGHTEVGHGPAGLGHLWEFYVPVVRDDGQIVGVVQLFEATPRLHVGLFAIRRWVWFGVGSGLVVLLIFNVVLVAANTRALTRRREQLEDLLVQLESAQDMERLRIIGALHDDIGQPLYRVLYALEGAVPGLEGDDATRGELVRAAQLVRSIDQTLRSELRMLHHERSDGVTLGALLQKLSADLTRETQLEVELEVDGPITLSEARRAALFRAAQEGTANVRRHAGATAIRLSLGRRNGHIELALEDDGVGFDGDVGLGLSSARSFLEATGGGLRITERKDGGTRLEAWVPEAGRES